MWCLGIFFSKISVWNNLERLIIEGDNPVQIVLLEFDSSRVVFIGI